MAWDAYSVIKDDPSATSAGPLGEAAANTLTTLPRPVRRVFSGRRDQIAIARDFVRRKLGNVPVIDEVVLLISELCTNAVLHTASGDGGTGAQRLSARAGTLLATGRACGRLPYRLCGLSDW